MTTLTVYNEAGELVTDPQEQAERIHREFGGRRVEVYNDAGDLVGVSDPRRPVVIYNEDGSVAPPQTAEDERRWFERVWVKPGVDWLMSGVKRTTP